MTTKDTQFTIRGFMIVVAIVAVILASPIWFPFLLLVLAVFLIPTGAAVLVSRWFLVGARRRQAAITFWMVSILINAVYAACRDIPDDDLPSALLMVWLLSVIPSLGVLGATWVRLSTSQAGVPMSSVVARIVSVLFMALLPAAMLDILWPVTLLLVMLVLLIPTRVTAGYSLWILVHERGRLAAILFWVVAVVSNVFYAAACIIPGLYYLGALAVVWLLVLLPAMVAMGAAWARLASREGAAHRRLHILLKTCVIAAAMAPALTLGTLWPLYLAFFASQPSLERLADRVAAGEAVELPQRARVFRVVRSNVDPAGNVGLRIGAAPADPVGFVRVRSGDPTKFAGTPYGTDLRLDLWGGWSYREDD